ncbi:MAG TPA: DUF2306 domain-containing protein [Sphingomonas sp.]|nr:DUF2306 domain-containing protein [Sphingomonas sp.]
MDAITSADLGQRRRGSRGQALLRRSAAAWFVVAALGQAAFVWMILAHYGGKTLAGDFAGWNEKPLIKGYVAGDTAGNAVFAAHVLLAAVVTIGGLLQFLPAIRRRAPALHRWIGRAFFSVAVIMALSGLWLTWVRQTYLSPISAIAVSVDGMLILAFSAIAWRAALKRDLIAHRRWAMRAFMVVNGVWFLRVGIMAWVLISGGGIGMNDSLSGPADIVIQFGAYLVPLAVLEIYFRAQGSGVRAMKRGVAGLMLLMTAITLVGVSGAVAFMWWPYM